MVFSFGLLGSSFFGDGNNLILTVTYVVETRNGQKYADKIIHAVEQLTCYQS
jgi:hypothetical protein